MPEYKATLGFRQPPGDPRLYESVGQECINRGEPAQ